VDGASGGGREGSLFAAARYDVGVLTRRELLERAEERLRARGGEEGAIEASRCFLRAMLVGIDETAAVPEELIQRVGEFLKLDMSDVLVPPALRRASTRPPASLSPLQVSPGERRRRVLFLGRHDSARIAMLEAVARGMLADEADVRAASLTPAANDPRAMRVLRHAGYATDLLSPRAVTVDDLSWADLVVTVGGLKDDWERFLPRTTPHQHEVIDDPVRLAREAPAPTDELEPFRAALRAIERSITVMRPPRSSRMPVAPSVRPSWPRVPSATRLSTPPPAPFPSSGRIRTKP
jgi:protein-tyrosine-phosphatase